MLDGHLAESTSEISTGKGKVGVSFLGLLSLKRYHSTTLFYLLYGYGDISVLRFYYLLLLLVVPQICEKGLYRDYHCIVVRRYIRELNS